MTTLSTVDRALDRRTPSISAFSPPARYFGLVVGALLLLLSGNAFAVITVTLTVDNEVDKNGNISVINGTNVEVSFSVDEDTDNDLNKNDKIELLRVSDDSVVDSTKRGKKKSGTVKLKVKNSEGEQLYVQYKRKGNAGTVITQTSHPDVPLWSIAKQNVSDLTIAVNALNTGAVSVAGGGFHDINEANTCQLSQTSFMLNYSAGNGCDAFASVQLPDGATLTHMDCLVFDNDSGSSVNIDVDLRRIDLATSGASIVFSSASSVDSPSLQTISDTTTTLGKVDNSSYAYLLWADFGPSSPVGLVLYGCTIGYN